MKNCMSRVLHPSDCPTLEAAQGLPVDLESPTADKIEKSIVLFHIFQACEQCGTKDDHVVVPKSRGAGIMVSDFICEKCGYLRLTEETTKLLK